MVTFSTLSTVATSLLIGIINAFVRPPALFQLVHTQRGQYMSISTPVVNIFDSVLSESECSSLFTELYFSDATDESGNLPLTIYKRRDIEGRSANFSAIELLIDSILTSLGDDSTFVEYWSRSNWISHVLHRDVDEHLASVDGSIRYPDNGHVLYILYEPAVTGGHTVVLEDVDDSNGGDNSRYLYIVPPRVGRLLRFAGHLLHGVPRPSLEFFLADQTVHQLEAAIEGRGETSSAKSLLEREYDTFEGNDDGSAGIKRFVVLFNTWGDTPPGSISGLNNDNRKSVEEDDSYDTNKSSGVHIADAKVGRGYNENSLLNGDNTADSNVRACEQGDSTCMPRSNEWCDAEIIDTDEVVRASWGSSDPFTMRIRLPTDRRRRDRYEQYLLLHTSTSSVGAFLIRRPEDNNKTFLKDGAKETGSGREPRRIKVRVHPGDRHE